MSFSDYETTELIEYLPEALFLEDWDGKILDVNSQACELLGYSKGELLNQNVDKIVPEGNPVLLPDQIDEATRSGKPIETINIRKDGTKVPVELRGRIIKVDGKERILVSVRDISERKEEEIEEMAKEWRSTFDTMEDMIFVLGKDHEIKKANESLLNAVGLSKEEVIGKKCYQLIHDKDNPIPACPLEQSIKTGETEVEEIYEQKFDAHFLVKTQPMFNEDGEIEKLVHQIQDITGCDSVDFCV